jgi:protein TonB
MRRKRLSKVYVISIGLHVALGLGVAAIPRQKLREVVSIALAETRHEEKKAEPAKREDRPKERPARPEGLPRTASHNTAPRETARAAEAFTDIGISLDSTALGGVAVPVSTRPIEEPKSVVVERPRPKVLTARANQDTCAEELVKARPLQLAQPQYTDAARNARVEGRVRLELVVDENGAVKDAKILSGLGYGLDEAAMIAAQKIRFRPATRCGRPVQAPFIISMRFVLGA